MAKQKVLVLYGGRSTEHAVSCRSAATVLANLDRSRFAVYAAAIDEDGVWWPQIVETLLGAETLAIHKNVPTDSPEGRFLDNLLPLWGKPFTAGAPLQDLVVFPVLHGTGGEDGTLQGFLDLLEVAYVGCDTMASAIAMNKLVAKRLAEAAGLKVVPYRALRPHDWQGKEKTVASEVAAKLGYPVFVKPVSLGSSVGISRATGAGELIEAVDKAFRYDEHVLIETGMNAREIEFAALGGYDPEVSGAGEIVTPEGGFYDYEEKYGVHSKTKVVVPAPLAADKVEEGKALAKTAFQALQLYGLARIDFFLTRDDNEFYFNEANTLPGFTSISQYPMLWQQAGVTLPDLLSKLVARAVERQKMRQAMHRHF